MNRLHDMINKLPLITSKDKNISTSIYVAINSDKKKKFEKELYPLDKYHKSKELSLSQAGDGEAKPLLGRFNPYLHKLIELIYGNIKCRFQVFGNSFCYLDFKNRQAVSFEDF